MCYDNNIHLSSKLLPDPPPPFLYTHSFGSLFLRIQFAPPIYLWVCNLVLEHD